MAYFANQEEVEKWGHEYLRNLAGEIGDEYQHRRESNETFADLLELVAQIAPYHMKHNSGKPRWSIYQTLI